MPENTETQAILYCNLNRSREAHELIRIHAEELGVNFICCTEPNWTIVKGCNWTSDTKNDSAIYTISAPVHGSGTGEGYSWVETNDVAIFCCYISPNADMDQYKRFLNHLQVDLRNQHKPATIVGDFNSKSQAWGSKSEDKRGEFLLEWIATNGLIIQNDGKHPTWQRGASESFLDLTLTAESIVHRIKNWEVLANMETLSDHNYIYFELKKSSNNDILTRRNTYKRPTAGNIEKIRKFNWIECHDWKDENGMVQTAVRACKETLTKPRRQGHRKPVPWWSKDLTELRKIAIGSKRHWSRIHKSYNATDLEKSDALVNYKKARKALRSSIKSAKREHLEGLLEDLDRNPWGTAYKMLSKKSPIAPMTEEESITQATLLFPVHERVSWHREPTAVQHPFTMAELSDTVEKIACKKASGPDEIPPEIIKAMITGQKKTAYECSTSL